MTEIIINANDRRIQYTATNGQTVFPYDFPIYAGTEISVVRNRSGVLSTLALTTNYTLSGIGAQAGGNVTLTAGALAGDVMTLSGATPYERTSDYGEGGDFKASTLNKDLDRLTIMAQQLDTRIGRALTLNIADPATGMELAIEAAADRQDRALIFNATGDGLQAGPTVTEIADAEGFANAAATSATNAATSATSASNSATSASASATAAATSATSAGTSATNAATSETNAAASATSASNSATSATGSASAASTSATAAATSATNAATSATNAGNSATAAATSATNASNSATAASTSETNAATSEDNAATSATAAEDWAIRPENDPVPVGSGGDGSTTFSAYHWAQKAADFATGDALNISVDDIAFTVLTGDNVQAVLDDIDDELANLGALADNDTISTNDIDNAAVTLAKMANLSQATIIGRATGAGTGVPTALTAAQVLDIVVSAGGATQGLTANNQTGTTYTFVLTDAQNTLVRGSNAAAQTYTVPANATTAFPVGSVIPLYQYGAGQITIAAAGGVTIRTPETLKLRKQYSTAALTKIGTNEWILAGDLEGA